MKLTLEQKKRIKTYYDRTQYDENNISKNLKDLFRKTSEIYNPITDIVVSITSNAIKELSNENEYLNNEVWIYNNMQEMILKISSAMYLYGDVFVEIIINAEKKIEYIIHDFENIEITEEKGVIKKFKVVGEVLNYTEEGKEERIPYEREYYQVNTAQGKKVIKREKIGDENIITPFSLETIPVVKFNFDTTIYEALNIIDKINENEAYIRSIFSIHGDPMLQANNIEPFGESEDEKDKLKEAKYTEKTVIFTQDREDLRQATFKYIELTNPLIPDLQRDITRLEKKLIDLFPELILVDTTTQNVSSETFDMKNSGLKAKIQAFRKSFLLSLNLVDNIALGLSFKSERVTQDSYKFLDIFKEQEKSARLNNISKALEIMETITELDLEEEFINQMKEIKTEVVKDLNALYT